MFIVIYCYCVNCKFFFFEIQCNAKKVINYMISRFFWRLVESGLENRNLNLEIW